VRIKEKWVLLILIFSFLLIGMEKEARKSELLFSFEKEEELKFLSGAPHQVSTEHTTQGKKSVKIELSSDNPYFTLTALEKSFNFQDFDKLRLDIYREGKPITLNLRIFDQAGNRYNCWYYLLRPGFNVVEYSIWGMSSSLNISQIRDLTFYSEQPNGTLFMDNIRLVRGEEDDSWLLPKTPPKPLIQTRGNIIKNGDFELGLLYWGSWGQWEGGVYIFGSGTGEDAFSGQASAAIICQKPGRGGIYTSPSAFFTLKPGNYKLTFYAKGKGEGVRMFWIFLKMREEGTSLDEAITENPRSERFDVPSQWTKYEYDVKVVKEIGPLALYFFNVGGGTLLIDGVSLIKEGEKPIEEKAPPKGKPSKVEIREGRVLLNGKPFFPLGFYNAEPEALKDTGFNLICRDPGPGTPGRDFLDRCEKNGIFLSVNLEGVLRAHLPWQAPEAIKPLMDHPAVFAWYTCDEPDHSQWNVPPPEMRLATQLIHKVDPDHPTWTVVMPWADSNIYQYADTVDIIATDMYPIMGYNREVIRVGQATDVLRRAVKWQRPVFMVTESTAQATPEEEYAMTYLAITHGANGILYWNYEDARRNPLIWETMLKIGKEIKELTPILTAPDSKKKIEVDNKNIHFLLKEYKGKYYLISLNASRESQRDVQIYLPFLRGQKEGKVLFENREVKVEDGILRDSFKGYERHIYEIL
jgi:hypothetical protein